MKRTRKTSCHLGILCPCVITWAFAIVHTSKAINLATPIQSNAGKMRKNTRTHIRNTRQHTKAYIDNYMCIEKCAFSMKPHKENVSQLAVVRVYMNKGNYYTKMLDLGVACETKYRYNPKTYVHMRCTRQTRNSIHL